MVPLFSAVHCIGRLAMPQVMNKIYTEMPLLGWWWGP